MGYEMKPFQGFNSRQGTQIYRRNMPHWRQDGCSYFVTFRLADSIPCKLIEQWKQERLTWLKAWGLDEPITRQEYQKRYEAIPEKMRREFERDQIRKPMMEMDICHGSCILRKEVCSKCLANALHFFHGKKLQCGDFVIMPNHVHWIVMPLQGYVLEKLMQQIKSFVSTELGKVDSSLRGKLWQAESYDHCIRNREELIRIRRYIENNPSKARLKEGYLYYRAEWLDVEMSGSRTERPRYM